MILISQGPSVRKYLHLTREKILMIRPCLRLDPLCLLLPPLTKVADSRWGSFSMSTSPSTIVWLLFCLTRGLSHLVLEAYGVPAGKDGSSMTSDACLKKA